MRRFSVAVLLAALTACGGSEAPTTPAGDPTPTPAPAPTPTPAVNPFAAACGTPLPAFSDSYGFGIKVQLEPTRNRKVLNASPLVRNPSYCEAAGLFGQYCNTRFEDLPSRVPCDHYLSGTSETGRPGPNWFQEINGRLVKCGGQGVDGDAPGCRLKDNNQYLLDVTQPGKYVACGGTGSPGTCGNCILEPQLFGKIHPSPAGLCYAE
jgi:hypothetical protein